LIRIDEALAAGGTGERWSDAFLHRLRGEILLKRDSANTAPAEGALVTAIAIAQQQKARSFELRAVLSLAKLYHPTDRPPMPIRARVCAQGLFADPGVSRDRGGANAPHRAGAMSQSKELATSRFGTILPMCSWVLLPARSRSRLGHF
jgi:hypothetical protein